MSDQDQPDEAPPPVAKWSPLQRTAVDFQGIIRNESWRGYFSRDGYVDGLVANFEKLRTEVISFQAGTFLLAFVVMAGGLPAEAKINAGGVEIPLSMFSQQVLCAAMAFGFSLTYSTYASLLVASVMIFFVYKENTGYENWEFFTADRLRHALFSSLIKPKNIGYVSPTREKVVIFFIQGSSWLTIAIHILAVGSATYIAGLAALRAGNWLAIALSAFSAITIVVTTVGFFFALFVPIPYRWRSKRA